MFSFRLPLSSSDSGPWSALCFHASTLDLAQVRRGKGEGKPVVELFATVDRGKDDLDVMRRLRKKYALQKARCTTLLPASDYQLLQIDTPTAPERDERMEVVRARLQDMIETPIAHVTVDAFDIRTESLAPGRPRNSYAVVAGNAAVAPKVQVFHSAGISLKAIDIPEMAQRNIAALCEQPNRAVAFLAFDESGGLLTFTANGELFMFRRIDVTLTSLLTDDMDRRSTLFDRIGLEVQRSMDNYDRQFGGFLPVARLVIGPQPEAEPLQGYLADYLAIKIEVVDLAELLDISAVPELKDRGQQARALQTIGAALRDEEAA